MIKFNWSFMTDQQFMELVERQSYGKTLKQGYKETARIIFKEFKKNFTPAQICNRYHYLKKRLLKNKQNSSPSYITKDKKINIKKLVYSMIRDGELVQYIQSLYNDCKKSGINISINGITTKMATFLGISPKSLSVRYYKALRERAQAEKKPDYSTVCREIENKREEIKKLADEIQRLHHQNLFEFLKMKFNLFFNKKALN